MEDFTGKTVLITGASRGIGAAAARAFAAAGASVALAARSNDQISALAAEIGPRAIAIPCDVSSWKDVEKSVLETVDTFGGLDVLINNAGVIDPIIHLAESDPTAWGQVVDINMKGVYHGLRAAIPVMREIGGGTILNISSGAATSALEGWSHYCATKAAVLSLTRCADKENRADGIRVIGLSPGTVATEMQINIRESGINPVSRLDPSAHIPADWVAKAMLMLCGPKGDPFQGTDFSLKNAEGRALAGLPPLAA